VGTVLTSEVHAGARAQDASAGRDRDAASDTGNEPTLLAFWSTAAAKPGVPVAYPNVVALDGKLWVGGRTLNASGMMAAPLASVQAYDLETDRWESDLP